jgi:hypothetical protein
VFQCSTVVADYDTDCLVILLDEREGGIGQRGGGAVDGDGEVRFHDSRLFVQLE